ncbi:uncharacterized protein LOC113279211 [Papaver somniferum]|uniref:uncharacterized protein LOC113279211 n=1 Tax=Papaver somniferum TaxID=3469 RepID=UPI000E6FEB18|nr:uncharacterized protein LOC113279211 [Papaver somniferum]
MLPNVAHQKAIEAMEPNHYCPEITHLFFADDCILFTKVTGNKLISQFSSSSGQLVNLEKSSVFFSKNLSPAACEDISQMFGMKKMDLNEKNLAVNLFPGRNRDKCFEVLINKMKSKLQRWQGKLVNQAGRSIQIKATLGSVAQHQMSIFSIPEKTSAKMNDIQRNYFWNKYNAKGVNLISWKNVCKPIAGRLGVFRYN